MRIRISCSAAMGLRRGKSPTRHMRPFHSVNFSRDDAAIKIASNLGIGDVIPCPAGFWPLLSHRGPPGSAMKNWKDARALDAPVSRTRGRRVGPHSKGQSVMASILVETSRSLHIGTGLGVVLLIFGATLLRRRFVPWCSLGSSSGGVGELSRAQRCNIAEACI